ncbi:MAG: PDZ domain-containing protein [Acidobacteriota bacterium]
MRTLDRSFRRNAATSASLAFALLLPPGLAASETAALETVVRTVQEPESEMEKKLADAQRELAALRALVANKEAQSRLESLYDRSALRTPGLSRPRLGVTIDTSEEKGARILDVSRSGPAYKAGIRSNDLVTDVNGESLLGHRESPGSRLIRLVREAGEEPLELRFQRGKETEEVTVTPGRFNFFYPQAPRAPRALEAPVAPVAPRLTSGRGLTLWGRWSDMELVPMNEGLSPYFGVESGLLVISPPSDNELLGLAAGDVVLSVGDREPRNAPHLLRILRSYEAGETVTVNIMRQKRREKLTFELPERVGSIFEATSFFEPTPSAAPRALALPKPAAAPAPDGF